MAEGTRNAGVAKMTAFCERQPLATLATALEQLAGKAKPDEAERLAHAVMIDVICARCPEAEKAFQAWAESDEVAGGIEAIVAAARG